MIEYLLVFVLILLSFLMGYTVAMKHASKQNMEMQQQIIQLHVSQLMLHAISETLFSMLAEANREEEAVKRIDSKLSDIDDEIESAMDLAEVDPIGFEEVYNDQ